MARRTPESTRTVLLIAAAIPALLGIAPTSDDIIPTDGMVITEDTTFTPGTYNLPNGVSIGADAVTLDMNGAELVGTDFNNYGVACLSFDDVTIKNGIINNYYYGVRIKGTDNLTLLNMDLSGNWVDPDSQGSSPPWLNINIGPGALGDRTNLGGGLFAYNADNLTVSGCTAQDGENGFDLYSVTNSLITGNNCSNNTGWGIHLYESTYNTISNNICDNCTRIGLGDSAGMLLVMSSNNNDIIDNSFQHSGDGFFIGNEHGCPSNDNLIQGNNGSFAGANAFEATFSSGNQLIDNIADGSNYGFWLGYSHSGNVIADNSIRANNTNGIEIEHGQHNTITGNTIVGNGGAAIVLRTDGQVHFPPDQFPCLELPSQEDSSFYIIKDNVITTNFGIGLRLENTTDSEILNNLVAGNIGGTASSNDIDNIWSITPIEGENIVGGPYLGGNYWDNYAGEDTDGDEIGDTLVPYTNGGQIAAPGDEHPLIGDPQIEEFDNPKTLCARNWIDLGRNTRTSGAFFDTANGTHFATDGADLYLLEGANSNRLSRFNPITNRYEPMPGAPETVWDGGGLQYGWTYYFASVGIQLNPDGTGKGPKLYAYEPIGEAWTAMEPMIIEGDAVANEALAFDPTHNLLYATIVDVVPGGDQVLKRRLAMFDPAADSWVGTTSKSSTVFGAGSEAEYLNGKIYLWRGGYAGGAVNGSDSWLDVFDIATDAWSATPPLQESGVIPGFRSGALDIWGVTITSDPENNRLFIQGGEANKQVYIFDIAVQAWSVTPVSIYDGGWGDSLEYVATTERLYQLDGRNAQGAPQGTAVLVRSMGDIDADGVIDVLDLLALLSAWGPCPDPCCPEDLNESGTVDVLDLLIILANWS